jgi:hypothetical protein
MAVVDRDGTDVTPTTTPDLPPYAPPSPDPVDGASPAREWSMPAMVLLAVLSVSAGAVHLAMVPAHASEWLPFGLAFAATGWLQIGLAIAFVARPTAAALRISCLANAVFIAAWLVTRIWGWPVGPEAFSPEAATSVDVVCVIIEAALVVLGYELLVRPNLGERLSSGARVVLSIIPVAVLLVTTWAISSPTAAEHSHSGSEAAGHTHGADGETAAIDDKGLSLVMNGAGEGGGHVHTTSVVDVDPATQALLDQQLTALQPLMDNYPTVADAEAAGYRRQGPYSPALGAHYMEAGAPNIGSASQLSDEALKHPMLIFDGTKPDSKLAGFMYNIYSTDTQNPPEGFIGPNDHWHYHTNVCIVERPDGGIDAPLGADTSAPQELCDKYGGSVLGNTGYMVHVWPVPGYESDQGLFSNLNSKLTCPNGTYYMIPIEEVGSRKNMCRDVNE